MCFIFLCCWTKDHFTLWAFKLFFVIVSVKTERKKKNISAINIVTQFVCGTVQSYFLGWLFLPVRTLAFDVLFYKMDYPKCVIACIACMYWCSFLHIHVSSFDIVYFILIYLNLVFLQIWSLHIICLCLVSVNIALALFNLLLVFSRASYISWFWSSLVPLHMKANILYVLL